MALIVDGKFGKASISALQAYFKVAQTGIIVGQKKELQKYYPSISLVSYGTGGSAVVKKMQKWLGVAEDGVIGPQTVKALQKELGISVDGIWGNGTSKALQKFLNSTSNSKSELVIDVSYVQKSINWDKVKQDGVKGAIIRCGYRGYGSGKLQEDSMFMSHISGANKVGLKLGVYFFTEAINETEGREEAKYVLKLLKKANVKLTYPIAIDTESIDANPKPRADVISVAKRTAAIKGFCEEIKKNGYEPMIYASTDWLNRKLNMSKLPYKVWVAQYNSKVTYTGSYVMWQYSSLGKVNGISQVVDLNRSYINIDTQKAPEPIEKEISSSSPKSSTDEVQIPTTPAPSTYTKTLPSLALTDAQANKLVHLDMVNWTKKIANDGNFHYVNWGSNPKSHECPICHNHPKGQYYGWNCIGFSFAALHHGGNLNSKCNCGVISNGAWEQMLNSPSKARSIAQSKVGLKEIEVIYNGGKAIPQSMLQPGDICSKFIGKTYHHTFVYIGDGKIAESTSSKVPQVSASRKYSSYQSQTKIAIRYTGKGKYGATAALRVNDPRIAQVKQWQEFINWIYGKEVVTVDGLFGSGTEKYTKLVQEKLGTTADGLVGSQTISAAKAYKK